MKQAMIFAAGLGTRLKPLTDSMPKALVRVGGRPLLEHVLLKLKAGGFSRVVVNVHHFSGQVIDYLSRHDGFGMDIRVSDETSCLLDTGGGLKKAAPLFDAGSPILIHNVDILSNEDLSALYISGKDADATLLVSERETQRYLLFDEEMRLVGWTNIATGEVITPYPGLAPSNCRRYAFSGVHVFSPRLFPLMETFPSRFGIMDFYLSVCAHVNIQGHVDDRLRLMDVGKQGCLSAAEVFLASLDAR